MDQLFRQEAIENRINRLKGTVSLVQPPIFSYLALLILVIVVISLVFLAIGDYSRKETVNGMLQPDTGVLRMAAPQPGIITELLVSEGEQVTKGQPLLRITSEKHGGEGFELNQTLISQYRFQVDSLDQQINQQQQKHVLQAKAMEDERASLQKRLSELDSQDEIFTERVKINQEIVEQVSKLAGTGYISDLELKKQKDSLLSLNQQKASLRARRLEVNNQIEQLTSDLAQLPLNQAAAIDQLQSQKTQLQSQLDTLRQQTLGELRAPADGMVTGLMANQGKSVSAGQHMLSVLPANSQLQAVIYVPTSAFGFIDKGQQTKLRYHAFPYQRFGIHHGEIIEISAHVTLPDETDIPGIITNPSYRVIVALQNQSIQAYDKDLPLRSGMKLEADIIIEQRSLIRWLFDPIFSLQKT